MRIAILFALASSTCALPFVHKDAASQAAGSPNVGYVRCPDGSAPVAGAQGPVPCSSSADCPANNECVNKGGPAGVCCPKKVDSRPGYLSPHSASYNGSNCPPPPSPTEQQAKDGCTYVPKTNGGTSCTDLYDLICPSQVSGAPTGGVPPAGGNEGPPPPVDGEGNATPSTGLPDSMGLPTAANLPIPAGGQGNQSGSGSPPMPGSESGILPNNTSTASPFENPPMDHSPSESSTPSVLGMPNENPESNPVPGGAENSTSASFPLIPSGSSDANATGQGPSASVAPDTPPLSGEPGGTSLPPVASGPSGPEVPLAPLPAGNETSNPAESSVTPLAMPPEIGAASSSTNQPVDFFPSGPPPESGNTSSANAGGSPLSPLPPPPENGNGSSANTGGIPLPPPESQPPLLPNPASGNVTDAPSASEGPTPVTVSFVVGDSSNQMQTSTPALSNNFPIPSNENSSSSPDCLLAPDSPSCAVQPASVPAPSEGGDVPANHVSTTPPCSPDSLSCPLTSSSPLGESGSNATLANLPGPVAPEGPSSSGSNETGAQPLPSLPLEPTNPQSNSTGISAGTGSSMETGNSSSTDAGASATSTVPLEIPGLAGTSPTPDLGLVPGGEMGGGPASGSTQASPLEGGDNAASTAGPPIMGNPAEPSTSSSESNSGASTPSIPLFPEHPEHPGPSESGTTTGSDASPTPNGPLSETGEASPSPAGAIIPTAGNCTGSTGASNEPAKVPALFPGMGDGVSTEAANGATETTASTLKGSYGVSSAADPSRGHGSSETSSTPVNPIPAGLVPSNNGAISEQPSGDSSTDLPSPIGGEPGAVPSAPDHSNLTSGSSNDSFANATENTEGDFTWESMFSLRSPANSIPDADSFRKIAGPAVPTSGQFVPCQKESDCFDLREPVEWCKREPLFTWTDKSCFCSNDTEVRSCIIERFDMSGQMQWTFCTPDSKFDCENAVRRRSRAH